MQAQPTLRLDDRLVAKAKRWASSHGISVSQAVAGFFEQLPDTSRPPSELSPWVQSLLGIAAPPGSQSPRDDELGEEYVDYLEQKYR